MVTVQTGLNYKFNYSEKHSWYKHSSLFKQRQASRKKVLLDRKLELRRIIGGTALKKKVC
jgi:hypothetical protein